MAISIKTGQEIESMRKGGKILAMVLEEVCKRALPGVSTAELDQFAENFILSNGGRPGFKGYHGFPASLCTARNEVIVHGIPRKDEFIAEGDLFTADCGVIYDGLYTDAARSVGVGEISSEKRRLLKTAEKALYAAIDLIKPGIHVGEIGRTIEKIIRAAGFHVIHDLTGHGVGRNLHEDPVVLNYWDGKPGPVLKPGMTLAIEPIFSVGTSKMRTLSDNWTLVTIDNSPAIQMEHTIVVTENGCEILTNCEQKRAII